ncbi:MAG TPA: SpoIID/LytB domain-containing protein [Gaiellaceae bacterium]|nr:SpoIID/LytB domain-containing protein [Gaiellaceae bacterium]
MVRRTAVLGFALLALVGGSAGARVRAVPAPATSFVFAGHGYGHGIGMSQYGALGYAQHGYTYAQILAHYFPGTTLGSAPATTLRVLLAEGKKTLTVSSTAPFTVVDGTGASHSLAAGAYAFGTTFALRAVPPFEGSGSSAPLTGPLTFSPGSAPLALLGKAYRGRLRAILAPNKTLEAVNVVSLEGYLYGVVPSEMPYIWAPDALEAQAVAARSYALATRKQTGDFDVYGDVRSQAYGGIAAEHFETTAAVDKTRRQVVLYNGKVATTFFFSTSGGRTAAIQDAWPKSAPVPYLVSVPDPYDTLSPWHNWGPVLVDGAKLRTALKLAGPVADLTVTPGSGGRAASVVVTDSLGDAVTVSADTFRTLLGLRSTWFTAGVLSLGASETPVDYGSSVDLSGVARGVAAPVLQERLTGGTWQPVGAVSPDPSGVFLLTETPEASTDYRLVAGKAVGPLLHVGVAPLVTLEALPGSAGVSGTVEPLLMGATVGLQQQIGTAWTTLTTATVDESGNFQALYPLQAGALYRARVAPGQGFAVGVTEPMSAP